MSTLSERRSVRRFWAVLLVLVVAGLVLARLFVHQQPQSDLQPYQPTPCYFTYDGGCGQ